MAVSGQKLDPETIEQIRALYASGMTKQAIARELGVSPSTVARYCQAEEEALEEARAERRREFIDLAWRNLLEAMELGHRKVQLALMSSQEFKEHLGKTVKELKEAGVPPDVIAEIVKGMRKAQEIPLGHISTYIGTLYDKQALAGGDPTEISESVVRWSDLE